jgi:hypothetical protein
MPPGTDGDGGYGHVGIDVPVTIVRRSQQFVRGASGLKGDKAWLVILGGMADC